jgi:hypothetical protein
VSGNSSSTGGYLVPSNLSVPGSDLTDTLQTAVVGITGFDPTLVRPRWQSQPPTQPSVTTDWCAIGVESYDLTDYPQVVHASDDSGDDLYRLERINLLTSFYGPNCSHFAGVLRDGFYINQNFMTLAATGIKFRSAENIIYISELINSQYVPRVDLFLNFMRMVKRTYPVESLLGAEVQVFASNGDSCVEIISEES